MSQSVRGPRVRAVGRLLAWPPVHVLDSVHSPDPPIVICASKAPSLALPRGTKSSSWWISQTSRRWVPPPISVAGGCGVVKQGATLVAGLVRV